MQKETYKMLYSTTSRSMNVNILEKQMFPIFPPVQLTLVNFRRLIVFLFQVISASMYEIGFAQNVNQKTSYTRTCTKVPKSKVE